MRNLTLNQHRPRALGVDGVAPCGTGGARGGRRDMVGLVHDEDVEGVAARRPRPPGVGQHLAQQPLGAHARQPGHGDDDARVEAQRVGGQAVGAPVGGDPGRVDDDELQAELLAHLVTPLLGEARRADDDDRAGPVAQQELLDDQAGLDRLAEPDVVCEQKIRARGLQGPAQRFELVGLERGARTEGRLEGPRIGRGDGAPAHCVDEGAERVRFVEGIRVDHLGQPAVGDDRVADLELPDDGELLAHAVLGERLERHHVLEPGMRLVGGAARQALLPDVGDRPGGAADLDDLPGFWHRGRPCGRGRVELFGGHRIPWLGSHSRRATRSP